MMQEGCSEIVLASDKPFRRLDHYKMHEYSRSHSAGSLSGHKEVMSATTSAFSLDSMFRRKRGRPPKNRIIEVWNESVSRLSGNPFKSHRISSNRKEINGEIVFGLRMQSQANSGSGQADTPQAIFTSFKLPKPNTPPLGHGTMTLTTGATAATTTTTTTTTSSGSHFIPPYPIHPVGHSASAASRLHQHQHQQQQHVKASPPELTRRTPVTSTTDKNSPAESASSGSAGVHPESPPPKSTVVKAAGTFYPLSAFPKNDPSSASGEPADALSAQTPASGSSAKTLPVPTSCSSSSSCSSSVTFSIFFSFASPIFWEKL